MNTFVSRWLWLATILLVLASSYGLLQRYREEQSNLAVSLAVEFDAVEAFAAGQGISMERALAQLKSQGLTAVVLQEETIGELAGQGRIEFRGTSYPVKEANRRVQASAIILRDPGALPRIQRGLQNRFGEGAGRLEPRDNVVAMPPISPSLLKTAAIGMNPDQVATARAAGLQIIGRVGNAQGLSQGAVGAALDWLKEDGVQVLLPLGDQVIGRKDLLPFTIKKLTELQINYATPEFSKLGGDANVVEAMPENVIRLHAPQLAEMEKLTFEAAVDRYRKAARERNIRILLIRPVTLSAAQPFEEFTRLVGSVAEVVRKDGMVMSVAHPYAPLEMPRWYTLALGFTGGLFAFVLLAGFIRPLWVSGFIGLGLAAASITHLGQQVNALGVSVLAPCAGFLLADSIRFKNPFGRAIVQFWLISTVSLVGGLFVAASMSGLLFTIKADEFRGIKIAVFVPILLVAGFYWSRLKDWREELRSAITWGTASLSVLLAGVIGLLIARTGNDGVEASGAEILFRGFLEDALYVRPRTKEFMLGHPALILGLLLLASPAKDHPRWRGWIVLVLGLGVIGQTGIVNTLCHGHIPLVLSVARVFLGATFGCILGLGIGVVGQKWLPKPER